MPKQAFPQFFAHDTHTVEKPQFSVVPLSMFKPVVVRLTCKCWVIRALSSCARMTIDNPRIIGCSDMKKGTSHTRELTSELWYAFGDHEYLQEASRSYNQKGNLFGALKMRSMSCKQQVAWGRSFTRLLPYTDFFSIFTASWMKIFLPHIWRK